MNDSTWSHVKLILLIMFSPVDWLIHTGLRHHMRHGATSVSTASVFVLTSTISVLTIDLLPRV